MANTQWQHLLLNFFSLPPPLAFCWQAGQGWSPPLWPGGQNDVIQTTMLLMCNDNTYLRIPHQHDHKRHHDAIKSSSHLSFLLQSSHIDKSRQRLIVCHCPSATGAQHEFQRTSFFPMLCPTFKRFLGKELQFGCRGDRRACHQCFFTASGTCIKHILSSAKTFGSQHL